VRNSSGILVLICFASLFLLCYSPALFQDRQFGFRDAGRFYYPLYERVQEEWNQGRWPLWEPEENAGMPLLGNPAAAVLYPCKLVFAVLPYAWGARIYIVMHSALAFITMVVLLRSWRISWAGSGLGALSYAFGEPILFQYCNVIYLVGAAWLPLGIHAVDRWVRLGRRWGLFELAGVLSMQVLGGDPQSAYLLGLAGAGYALGLACSRALLQTHRRSPALAETPGGRARSMLLAVLLIAAVLLWSGVTVWLGAVLPKLRERHLVPPTPPLKWMPWTSVAVSVAWCLAGVSFVYLYYWRRRGWRLPLGAMCLGLLLAAVVAIALTAAQLLPLIEFIQLTTRVSGSGAHDIYSYSVEPYRLAELIWPDVTGRFYDENSFWPEVMRLPGVYPMIWVPSLYLGGMTVILAVSALAVRQGTPWRVWLSVIAVVSLLGALGQYTSPIWVMRTAIAMAPLPGLERVAADLGSVDLPAEMTIRDDGFLKDGDGSIYWWMATVLPGFRSFRYPAKLFSFTSLALAALAAVGWDDCCAGRSRRTIVAIGLLIIVSFCLLAGVLIGEHSILTAFRSYVRTSEFGPFNAAKAYEAIVRSLVHGLLVLGLALVPVILAPRRPQTAGAAALILTALDLAVANSRSVMTVPQSLFEHRPALLEVIERAEAERDQAVPAPFRVHRMSAWNPPAWNSKPSTERVGDFVAWERETIQPKYGITLGIEYTYATGVAELADHDWYFTGYYRPVAGPDLAKTLDIAVGESVVYFPRRAYDMWNTRYFVVPAKANGWREGNRASAAFRFDCELIYPEKRRSSVPGDQERARAWAQTQDFEVLRNEHEAPRAWVVHNARALRPNSGLPGEIRAEDRQAIFYPRDVFWTDATLDFYDPREVAWLNRTDLAQIRSQLSRERPNKSESVQVRYPDPQHVILNVTLESSGLVILADVDYPGWQLTIDDKPAQIYRVNVAMRGALVSAGPHRLVYTYRPRSFQVGLWGSIAGLAAWLSLGIICVFRPVHRVLGGSD
jgi:hypothetical protein